MVSLLGFPLKDTPPDQVVSRVKRTYLETGKVFFNDLTFIFAEIPKFKKNAAELESAADIWLFLMSRRHELEQKPENIQERLFMKFLEEAEIARLSELERNKYERSLKTFRDNELMVLSARLEGEAIGEARGEAKGEARGEARGRLQEKTSLAKKMLALGFDLPLISEASGLPVETIREIHNQS